MFWQACHLPLLIGECFWPRTTMVVSHQLVAVELLQSHFFVVATTTACYNDKMAFVSTVLDIILPETSIGFPFIWKQPPNIVFSS